MRGRDRLEAVRQRAAAEWHRSARVAEIAARHELAAECGPPALRQFHREAAAALRQVEAYHLVAAGVQSSRLARLRSRAQLASPGARPTAAEDVGVAERRAPGAGPVTRRPLASALPAAIRRGELFLEYQPIVDLRDGAIAGAEALVRWRHPDLGVLYPGQFIGVAEQTGMITGLGRAVLWQACRDAARWRGCTAGPPFVSVNVSPLQLESGDLDAEVAEIIDACGLPADRLGLEITEGAIVSAGRHVTDVLRRLDARGVTVAVDDFGTGYSNLSNLRRLPARILKIDRSLVADLCPPGRNDSSEGQQILEAIGSLARLLGLSVTAEGVETSQQAECVRAIGYDYAQGWYFGRPVPAADFEAALATPGQRRPDDAGER